MKFDVLTLFPEMFEPMKQSIIGRALKNQLLELNLTNIRDFSKDKHKKVDDTPYGGGAGMLMKPDVVWDAWNSVKSEKTKTIYMSPKGTTLTQKKVEELAKEEHLVIICGHYEGIDQRVIDKVVDEEIKQGSKSEESFSNDLLEYPQYTRPEIFLGEKVPEVLISGNHKNIDEWRRKKSLEETFRKRPELLEKAELTDEDKKYLRDL